MKLSGRYAKYEEAIDYLNELDQADGGGSYLGECASLIDELIAEVFFLREQVEPRPDQNEPDPASFVPNPLKQREQDAYLQAGDILTKAAQMQSDEHVVLYRVHPNGGLTLARASEARHLDQIYRALSDAKTWGEFRQMLPEGAWDDLEAEVGERLGWPGLFEDDDDPEVRWDLDDTPFSGYDDIPRAADGDYPTWMQPCLGELIPADVLQRVGKLTVSVINGDYWHIDPSRLRTITAALRRAGFTVKEAGSIRFY